MQLARVCRGFPCSRLVLIRAVGRELCPGRGAEGAGSLREQEHSCRFCTASAPPALKQPFQAAPLGLVTLVAPGSPETRCWGGWGGGLQRARMRGEGSQGTPSRAACSSGRGCAAAARWLLLAGDFFLQTVQGKEAKERCGLAEAWGHAAGRGVVRLWGAPQGPGR